MNPFFVILAVLLLVFIIWQGRVIVPRVFSFLLPVRRHLYFEELPRDPKETAKMESIDSTVNKLETMGFKRLGLMAEKFPLWAGVTREIVMVSSTDKVIASLGFRRRKPSYFFYTPFAGGEVVITGHNSFRDFKRDGFLTTVVPSGDAEEMLVEHKKRLEEFVNMGFIPFTEYSRESVIKATNQYYAAPYPKQQLRLAGILNLLFLLVCLFLLVILVRGAMA